MDSEARIDSLKIHCDIGVGRVTNLLSEREPG
jgi:hypothetical protein